MGDTFRELEEIPQEDEVFIKDVISAGNGMDKMEATEVWVMIPAYESPYIMSNTKAVILT